MHALVTVRKKPEGSISTQEAELRSVVNNLKQVSPAVFSNFVSNKTLVS